MERYLQEDICVPYASMNERVHRKFDDALNGFIQAMAQLRDVDRFNIPLAAPIFSHLQQCNAMALSYAVELVAGLPLDPEEDTTGIVVDVDNDDPCMSMAHLLVTSARRVAHELIESIRTQNGLYIYHHQVVIYDIVCEMTRLANESCVIRSERLLEPDHPHMALLEQRWAANEAALQRETFEQIAAE
jgi:hypothetical protein